MTTLSPLVFFGTEDFSAEILHSLTEHDWQIEAVITKPDRKTGRGQKTQASAVKTLALKHNIKVLEVVNKDDLRQAVAQTSQKTGILASFGKIIPEDVILAFEHGIINVHPSLLPKYRGASPIESAILNGDQKTGVSIMLLANEVDAGDVFSQVELELKGQENAKELYASLAQISGDLLHKTLVQIEQNDLKARAQDHSQASFCQMIQKSDGILRPQEKSAQELERQIRAYCLWPKSKIELDGKLVTVLSAEVGSRANSAISLVCRDGKYLNITSLLSPSGKPTSTQQYYNNFLSQ